MNDFPTASPLKSREALSNILVCDFEELLCIIDFDALKDVVIASGSLVEGLGNECSDIDLFILSPVSISTRKQTQFYWQSAHRWVDVSLIGLADVEKSLIEVNFNKGIAPLDWGAYKGPRLTQLDLYHRLLLGIVLTTVGFPEKLMNLLSKEILCHELASVQISLCRQFWSDAVGSFRSHQYKQAWYAAKIALGYSIDAYSALLGQTNPGEKWRWSKVHRLEQDVLDVREKFYKQQLEWTADARIEAVFR